MVKEVEKLTNKALMEYCEQKVLKILNRYLPIEFIKSNLYLISQEDYKELLEIDALLMPKRKDTRKTNIYSINTFISIVNPLNVAVSYTLTPVEKRKQISDIQKIVDTLPREAAVTKNKLKDEFDSYIENNEVTEDEYNDLKIKLDYDFKLIDQLHTDIKNNSDKYNGKIKIASNPVLHAQIRYYYFDKKGEKQEEQKHLSSEKPSVMIFNPSANGKKRKDNKITEFLNNSKRVFGDVYINKDIL